MPKNKPSPTKADRAGDAAEPEDTTSARAAVVDETKVVSSEEEEPPSPGEGVLGYLSKSYMAALHAHPLQTKGLTAGGINIVAQLTALQLRPPATPRAPGQAPPLNSALREILGTGVFGYCVHTPLCQWWYTHTMPGLRDRIAKHIEDTWLADPSGGGGEAAKGEPAEEGVAPAQRPPNRYLACAVAVLLSSLLFDPIYFAVQIFFNGLLTGKFKSPEEAANAVRKNWATVYSSAQRMWPAFRVANFLLVPNALVIPMNSVASYFWNTYFLFKEASLAAGASVPRRTA